MVLIGGEKKVVFFLVSSLLRKRFYRSPVK